MSSNPTSSPPGEQPPEGDPWAAFGYLVAGVAFYGVIGYVLSVWLDAPWLVPVGILVGATFGVYLVFARYRFRGVPGETDSRPGRTTGTTTRSATQQSRDSTTPIDHDRPATGDEPGPPADRDDRGDT